jgi:plasmid stabilization system protein ParE
MNFRVRWTQAARDQLAEIWLAHTDQAGVTASAHRIDTVLARNPANQGEERPNNCRVVFDAPLIVLYRINATRNVVTVLGVGRYGTA